MGKREKKKINEREKEEERNSPVGLWIKTFFQITLPWKNLQAFFFSLSRHFKVLWNILMIADWQTSFKEMRLSTWWILTKCTLSPILDLVIYFYVLISLCETQRSRDERKDSDKETVGSRVRESVHPLLHCRNTCRSPSWATWSREWTAASTLVLGSRYVGQWACPRCVSRARSEV